MKNKIIYTNVEWFSATDDPNKNLIPSEIIEAKNVWNANGGKSTSEICMLVSKFIKCNFIAENFEDWKITLTTKPMENSMQLKLML